MSEKEIDEILKLVSDHVEKKVNEATSPYTQKIGLALNVAINNGETLDKIVKQLANVTKGLDSLIKILEKTIISKKKESTDGYIS